MNETLLAILMSLAFIFVVCVLRSLSLFELFSHIFTTLSRIKCISTNGLRFIHTKTRQIEQQRDFLYAVSVEKEK